MGLAQIARVPHSQRLSGERWLSRGSKHLCVPLLRAEQERGGGIAVAAVGQLSGAPKQGGEDRRGRSFLPRSPRDLWVKACLCRAGQATARAGRDLGPARRRRQWAQYPEHVSEGSPQLG